MVASNTLELPYYKSIGRQRRRGFGALPQVTGETAIPFFRNYIVPAAKRVGSDLLELAVPEVVDVGGKKNFKTAAKNIGRQTMKKQVGGGRKQKRRNPVRSLKRYSQSRREIFTNIAN